MLKEPFNFKKKRTVFDAVIFGLFYVGCFSILVSVIEWM